MGETRLDRIKTVLRVTSGNFLEQFDFFLFGFYAQAIAKAFFPTVNEVNGLLLTFTTFWLGALMRPVGAIVLGVAGVFQFSTLKYRCLDKCRTPFSFVNTHWRGAGVRRQSFMLGVHHGIFCVGCCWAIMLLMLVVGTGSVGWMLALGAVMAVEKNVAWGRRLSGPLGVGLLLASAAILVLNV